MLYLCVSVTTYYVVKYRTDRDTTAEHDEIPLSRFSPVMTDTTGSAFCLQLRNQRRTCYSNSATATLLSLRSFQGFLSTHQESPSPLLQELRSLCEVGPGEVATTATLRQLVTEINRDHQDWTQTGREQDPPPGRARQLGRAGGRHCGRHRGGGGLDPPHQDRPRPADQVTLKFMHTSQT